MADFVRDDVRLREIARRAKPLRQVTEETQIDVDLVIPRAIERSDSC